MNYFQTTRMCNIVITSLRNMGKQILNNTVSLRYNSVSENNSTMIESDTSLVLQKQVTLGWRNNTGK